MVSQSKKEGKGTVKTTVDAVAEVAGKVRAVRIYTYSEFLNYVHY